MSLLSPKTLAPFYPILLLVSTLAHAQDDARRELQRAATGQSFRIGQTQFRLVPDATVAARAAGQSAPAGQVAVGRYQLGLGAPRARSARAVAAAPRLAAAVDASGRPVVVTSALEVYHRDVSVLRQAARATGGKLTYASAIGGDGKIEYASVAEAMAAMGKIEGLAGVRAVSPAIVDGEESLD